LQQLYIGYNFITDEACDVIATVLKYNTSLVELKMINNSVISGEAVQQLVEALKFNNTLKNLRLPHYPEGVKKKIKSLQEEVDNSRQSRGCLTKLNVAFQ